MDCKVDASIITYSTAHKKMESPMKISSAIAFMQENLSPIFDAEHFDFPPSQKLPCCKISPNTLSLRTETNRSHQWITHGLLVYHHVYTFMLRISRFKGDSGWTL